MSETKKRYKNGVEIKPSEVSKNKTAPNESNMESLDLSNEDKLLDDWNKQADKVRHFK